VSNKHEHIDRAIRAYNKAYDVPDDWPIRDVDRQAFRAGVAELLRGMDGSDLNAISPAMVYGFNAALAEIKRRAGIVEGEG
jgi:hypothetical protein